MNAITQGEGVKPFTRIISTPGGWPWDQVRAAQLEAQHTSPVAGMDVTILVKRIEPWAMGQPGKFVAAYIRGAEAKSGLSFTLDVQGRPVTISLPSRAASAAQTRDRLWLIGSLAVIIIGIACLVTMALQRKAADEARLTALETQIERQWRDAKGVLRAKADAQSLEYLDLKGHTVEDALKDLKFLAHSRDPEVRLETYYWNNGYWGVEARGPEAPLKSQSVPLERSTKPVRPGVWLWVASEEAKP